MPQRRGERKAESAFFADSPVATATAPATRHERSDTTIGSEELSSLRALRTDSMLEDDRAGAVKQRPAALGMAVPGS